MDDAGEGISREMSDASNQNGYTAITNCRVHRMAEVGPPAVAVYVALVSHAEPGRGIVWPGTKRLAELTGLCQRSIRNAISTLSDKGWITREHRRAKGGATTSNLYRILHRPPTTSGTKCSPPGTECHGGRHESTGGGGIKCSAPRHEMYPEQEPVEQEPVEQEPGNNAADEDDDGFLFWKKAEALAVELQEAGTFRVVNGGSKAAPVSDRCDVLRACRMVTDGVLKRTWLDEAAQKTRDGKPKDNGYRYFLRTLRGICGANGLDFEAAAARIEVPESLRKRPGT